ncbi:MAG: L-lactate dehydrogenase [Candidatus Dojkabacteria bacterium]
MSNPSGRVVVIGAGNVGASIAYSILNQEIAYEILMLDIAEEMAKAQVLDMVDASNFTHGVSIKYAEYKDINDGDIVVITCGAAQKEGQTRTELLGINAKIIRDVISKIKATKKDVYICMVTNPVDVLAYIAVKESGLPASQVFGSGTILDTSRVKGAIAKEANVNANNVHAYIMGEHGDTSFPVLSSGNIANMPLESFVKLNTQYYTDIAEKVRNTAYEIIKGKKATYYGIGNAVASICKSIIRNENKIYPLSVMLNGEYGVRDVSIGVPVMLNSNGFKIVGEVPLNEMERKAFEHSVETVKANIKSAN